MYIDRDPRNSVNRPRENSSREHMLLHCNSKSGNMATTLTITSGINEPQLIEPGDFSRLHLSVERVVHLTLQLWQAHLYQKKMIVYTKKQM